MYWRGKARGFRLTHRRTRNRARERDAREGMNPKEVCMRVRGPWYAGEGAGSCRLDAKCWGHRC